MNYHVNDHTPRGKVFASLIEASSYAEDYRKATREILCITETKRDVTHRYDLREEAPR